MKAIAALLLFAGISAAQAAALPSFEQTLGRFRVDFLDARARQTRAKAQAASQDIDVLASDTERLHMDAQRLRQDLNDLRWRAQRPNDPWLRNDLQRLAWNLQTLSRDQQNLVWRSQSVLNAAKKDPAAVAAARRFQSSASWLRSETGWLQMDGQNAAWDFRRAGYDMEAFDIENALREADASSRNIENIAGALLAKVGG